jgi:hypothetical protein
MKVFIIALAALLVGCSSSLPRGASAEGDWRLSEVASAIDSFRKKDSDGAKIPREIRSIELAGGDTLRVYLSDHAPLSGFGCEVILKKSRDGAWTAVSSQFLDQ